MQQWIKIFGWGLFISFLGSLPLGTLNIAAMQISISDGISPALWFAAGALTAEIIYVRLSLVAMDRILQQKKLLRFLEKLTIVIILALSASSFWAAMNPSVEKSLLLSNGMHRYVLGIMMSAVNPMQIPFWFGWSSVLFSKHILKQGYGNYTFYVIGIGAGTFLGNCVFIFGGRWVVERLNASLHLLNWVIGFIFLITGIIQWVRVARKKDAVHQLEHPEEITSMLEDQIPDQNAKR